MNTSQIKRDIEITMETQRSREVERDAVDTSQEPGKSPEPQRTECASHINKVSHPTKPQRVADTGNWVASTTTPTHNTESTPF